MLDNILTKSIIFAILLAIIYLPRAHRQAYEQAKESILQMIRQIQANQPIATDWSIDVSSEMRDKLCYPLTPTEVKTIAARTYEPEICVFVYKMVDFGIKGNDMWGTVEINIRYLNCVEKKDICFEQAQIKICFKRIMGEGWYVHSVQPLDVRSLQ